MLVIGGEDALQGIQNLTFLGALPFALVMVFMCVALLKDLRSDPVTLRGEKGVEVLEAAVVGWPEADTLIKPKAFVVLKTPDKAGEALKLALQEHCREKLAPFKYPRWLEFRAELPKTATGKIQRFKLRELES